MVVYETRRFFRDRGDAGRRLAKELGRYYQHEAVVLAIPRGGVPVAIEVAKALGSPLDIVVTRKIPLPENPEAGYGAVTEDGTIVLNKRMVKQFGITQTQIKRQAEAVIAEIKRRSAIYRGKLIATPIEGRTAIIIDDGLATGYTMAAAIESVRQRQATKIIVAVPVASGKGFELVKPLADDTLCLVVAPISPFAVANFYHYWHDLTDEEVIDFLERWSARHIKPAENATPFNEKRAG